MSKKRKVIILIIIVAVLIGIIGLNLGKFLVESDKLEKADAIAVFSGDSGARTERAVELLKEGYGDYLILSGGKVYDDVTMAELMKNHAIKLGVDESKILIDDEASTTNENAEFTTDIIEENNFKSVIVVTSDYHTRRSKLPYLLQHYSEFQDLLQLQTMEERSSWLEYPSQTLNLSG